MMAFARSSWRRNRTISRVNSASRLRCATAGLAFGPRRGVASAARSCLRQPDSIEEYTRSRRIKAPRSAGDLQRSYACKMRRLSAGEIVRRRLMARTSGLNATAENLCAASDRLIDELIGPAADSELPPQYADAIVRAINEAKAVVVVLSASAVASSQVGREIERATSKHKQIIAFRIDAAALNPALEYFLGESQWIDVPALGMSAALTKMAEAVEQGSATSAHEDPVTHRGGGTLRRVAFAAAILVCVGAAAAIGMHFWSLNHRTAQPAAAVAITDKSIAVLPRTRGASLPNVASRCLSASALYFDVVFLRRAKMA
jgi:hypothetical protein